MPVTKEQVKKALMPEEPDYLQAKKLGKEALPFLKIFVKGKDEAIASKAAYLAGLISGAESFETLLIASKSKSDVVRIAAASTAQNLKAAEANKVLITLIKDSDYGVRDVALSSLPENVESELVNQIKLISKADPFRTLRQKASLILEKLK